METAALSSSSLLRLPSIPKSLMPTSADCPLRSVRDLGYTCAPPRTWPRLGLVTGSIVGAGAFGMMRVSGDQSPMSSWAFMALTLNAYSASASGRSKVRGEIAFRSRGLERYSVPTFRQSTSYCRSGLVCQKTRACMCPTMTPGAGSFGGSTSASRTFVIETFANATSLSPHPSWAKRVSL